MADTNDDCMQQPWACASCFAKFTFGKLRLGRTGIECPKCRSEDVHCADGQTRSLTEEIAPVQDAINRALSKDA
jgi:hypothetical protein